MKWAGLSYNAPLLENCGHLTMPFYARASSAEGGASRSSYSKGEITSIVELNDDGFNFRQIADIVEAAL